MPTAIKVNGDVIRSRQLLSSHVDIFISVATEPSPSADEDRLAWLKAPERG